MKAHSFRLRTLFLLTSVAAVLVALFCFNPFSSYLASILTIASAINYISRFMFDRTQMNAAIYATLAGIAWGAFSLGTFTAVTMDAVSGILGFWFGGTIGMLVSFVAVVVFAMIPGPRIQYIGERLPPPKETFRGFEPYTDTQGF